MTCPFCVGFCEASVVERKTVSIFDGEDYELQQALDRSKLLPQDVTATNLRMFFCLEVGQMLLRRQCIEIGDRCKDAIGSLSAPWLAAPFLFTKAGLDALELGVDELTLSLEALDFEFGIRKQGGDTSVSAQIFTEVLTEPLIRSLKVYRRCIARTDESVRRPASRDHAQFRHVVGAKFVEFFSEVGVMPQDYVSIINLMHQISATETISPWSSKLPFL